MSLQQFTADTLPSEKAILSESNQIVAIDTPLIDRFLVASETETLGPMARQLVAEAPSRKRLRQRSVNFSLSAAAITAASGLMSALTNGSGWIPVVQTAALATLGLTSFAIFVVRRQLCDSRLKQIAAMEDVRAVGPLLDVMESSQEMWEYDDPSRRAIKAALIRLLPRLKLSDVSWLTDAQRTTLTRTLYYCTHPKYPWHYDPDLAVALLSAMEQAGASDALEYVKRLAAMPGADPQRKRVREAAQSCVPFLETRANEWKAKKTLLRASQPTIEPKQLLRPLGGKSTASSITFGDRAVETPGADTGIG